MGTASEGAIMGFFSSLFQKQKPKIEKWHPKIPEKEVAPIYDEYHIQKAKNKLRKEKLAIRKLDLKERELALEEMEFKARESKLSLDIAKYEDEKRDYLDDDFPIPVPDDDDDKNDIGQQLVTAFLGGMNNGKLAKPDDRSTKQDAEYREQTDGNREALKDDTGKSEGAL